MLTAGVDAMPDEFQYDVFLSKNADMWVKILVLAHTPGQMVTVRWELL